ncbi:DMT family transporter [uncultured Shewanella sp.]|uniref:DMT family transporter n=1 Tax=uncultured Shewanella sp. TaxID=173975 RepID=UPI00262180AB|nr:DMT family transporter [uncultured Shewanella sp.]
MMSLYIVIALLNGVVISLSRVLNGQLSLHVGPLKASVYNHLVGFFLLTLLLILYGFFQLSSLELILSTPWYLYLGGVIGALYVALNSFILSRIGAANTGLLVISGQMIAGIFLDGEPFDTKVLLFKMLGVLFIAIGIFFLQSNSKPIKKVTNISHPKTS